jgi:hypothetical protein
MMYNYVIAVYVSFWSWHVYGSHSVCLPKSDVTGAARLRGCREGGEEAGWWSLGSDGRGVRGTELHCRPWTEKRERGISHGGWAPWGRAGWGREELGLALDHGHSATTRGERWQPWWLGEGDDLGREKQTEIMRWGAAARSGNGHFPKCLILNTRYSRVRILDGLDWIEMGQPGCPQLAPQIKF